MKHKQIGLSLDGETITFHKFHGNFDRPSYATEEWLAQNRELLGRGAGVDVETTGLRFADSKVIELAIKPFVYRKDTGEILVVEEGYTSMEDPQEPLSEQIQQITGLTNEMLKGKKIDWTLANELLGSADLVIAHNSKFDRPFVDRFAPSSKSKIWGCSLSQIDWSSKGFGIQKLEILAHYHGFFVDAHRAMNDVNAMINLLRMTDDTTNTSYLKELIDASVRTSVVVYANGSPYETKDILKAQGYRWDNIGKVWHRTVYEDALSIEIKWLEEAVYSGKFSGKTKVIPATKNFVLEE